MFVKLKSIKFQFKVFKGKLPRAARAFYCALFLAGNFSTNNLQLVSSQKTDYCRKTNL